MSRNLIVIILIITLLIAGYVLYSKSIKPSQDTNGNTPTITQSTNITPTESEKNDLIRIDAPQPGSTISSPVNVSGEARGTWFFEATFPVVIVDWDGRIIGEGYAQAQSDWMTEDFVPFEGTITFERPEITQDFMKRGAIIFQKNNPSDLPENDDALEIAITYE